MKRLMIIVIAIIALSAVGYMAFKQRLKTDLSLNSKVAVITDAIDGIRRRVVSASDSLREKLPLSTYEVGKVKLPDLTKKPSPEKNPEQGITLYLKHGGVIDARLLSKTQDEYTIDWKGETFVIKASQVERVEYKTQKAIEWPYKNDVVVKKTNGIIVDGEIIDASADELTVLFREGGGGLELGIRRPEIDHLMFAPLFDKESQEIEARLKGLFPKMKFYKEGNVTIVTDSYATWVRAYKKTINKIYTDIYLEFFRLFKARGPKNQNFVVIFDDPIDFADYCSTDGVPFWLVLGYFKPDDKTLYLYNAFGEKMEKDVLAIIVNALGKFDEWVESLKKQYGIDKRYDIFIDGQTKEFKDRFWDAYNFYKGELSERTLSTLRHELTHEVFHNWGLQSILLSKSNIDKKEILDKKKEFLETKDLAKKKELFELLMKLGTKAAKDVKMEASESWLNEGVATYCGTDPIGAVDEAWLFTFQEMERKNEINPIEFLTSFKMGSFPGLSNRAVLNSYAQSWALTTFLMSKYPSQFMDYQKKIIAESLNKDEDKLEWLLKLLNKDLPTLEREFREYMTAYGKVEDPDVKRFMKYYEIWTGLQQSKR